MSNVGEVRPSQVTQVGSAVSSPPADTSSATILKTKADQALGTVVQSGASPISDGPTLQTARFGVLPSQHSFGDAPVEIKRFEGVDNKVTDGKTLHHNYSYDSLKEKGSGLTLFGTDEAEEASPSFQKSAKCDWTTHGHVHPAGQAGRFVSVSTAEGGDTGHGPTATHSLATIDTQQKREVSLDELLSPRDLKGVYSQVESQLANNPQGSSYKQDPATLQGLVNKNFGLNEADGKTTLTVMLPATDSNKVAEFTFPLPGGVSTQ